MTQNAARLYLSKVISPQSQAACASEQLWGQGMPLCTGRATAESAPWCSKAPQGLGEPRKMSPPHSDPAQSIPRLFVSGAAPEGAQRLACTPEKVRVARAKFSVIPTADGSTKGATWAGEQVSHVNSPRRRDLLLLTLYSLSCPWMVSRCTRVHVRAMAVLFKTLILTSVGAALGSGRSGTKWSVVSTRRSPRPAANPASSARARRLCHLLAPLVCSRHFIAGRNRGRFLPPYIRFWRIS